MVTNAVHFVHDFLFCYCNTFHFVQVLASFFAKTANKRVLLGIPDNMYEADFVLRVCGRYVRR